MELLLCVCTKYGWSMEYGAVEVEPEEAEEQERVPVSMASLSWDGVVRSTEKYVHMTVHTTN